MTAGISNRCSTKKNGPAGAEPFYPKFFAKSLLDRDRRRRRGRGRIVRIPAVDRGYAVRVTASSGAPGGLSAAATRDPRSQPHKQQPRPNIPKPRPRPF